MFTVVLKAFAVAGLIIALFWRSPNYEAAVVVSRVSGGAGCGRPGDSIEKRHLDRAISSGLRAL